MNRFSTVRIAAARPEVKPGAVSANAESCLRLIRRAEKEGVDVVVFPELCLTGYTCADLFYQTELLTAAEQALKELRHRTTGLGVTAILGLPLLHEGRLYNVAAVIRCGRIFGFVPKTHLPNTGEFYEKRWFTPGGEGGQRDGVPFGTDLVFESDMMKFAVEICEDLWGPVPPSVRSAVNGAQVLFNLSAGNELTGKSAYRRQLVLQHSARCIAAYAYAGAGPGESSTDLVFSGELIIGVNGREAGFGNRFDFGEELISAEVDLEVLDYDRRRHPSFYSEPEAPVRTISIGGLNLGFQHRAPVAAHPFVPCDAAEVLAIQSTGLATRLRNTGIKKVVLGLSGGLDSTLALIVCIEAFRRLALDSSGIHVLTMPGFGTTGSTRTLAHTLARETGILLEEINITDICSGQFRLLGHDGTTPDITYENVQARQRTQFLMNRANQLGAFVVGTGDLSEVALGWCTFAGDHISHYGVNAGVPKTLIRHLITSFAVTPKSVPLRKALLAVADLPVSPELTPPKDGEIAQKTEEIVGPYELHDFFLYYRIRYGFSGEKIEFLANRAFGESYTAKDISKWYEMFIRRFTSQQYKRNCFPEGPKVGPVNLSPRGDWRMPGDSAIIG